MTTVYAAMASVPLVSMALRDSTQDCAASYFNKAGKVDFSISLSEYKMMTITLLKDAIRHG